MKHHIEQPHLDTPEVIREKTSGLLSKIQSIRRYISTLFTTDTRRRRQNLCGIEQLETRAMMCATPAEIALLEQEIQPEYAYVQNISIDQEGSIQMTQGNGDWSGHGSTIESITGDGKIESTINQLGQTTLLGLSTKGSNHHTAGYPEFGIMVQANETLNIFEKNGSSGVYNANVQLGDKISVHREGSSIIYKHNGNTVHTSTYHTTAELVGDIGMRSSGHSLGDVRFGEDEDFEALIDALAQVQSATPNSHILCSLRDNRETIEQQLQNPDSQWTTEFEDSFDTFDGSYWNKNSSVHSGNGYMQLTGNGQSLLEMNAPISVQDGAIKVTALVSINNKNDWIRIEDTNTFTQISTGYNQFITDVNGSTIVETFAIHTGTQYQIEIVDDGLTVTSRLLDVSGNELQSTTRQRAVAEPEVTIGIRGRYNAKLEHISIKKASDIAPDITNLVANISELLSTTDVFSVEDIANVEQEIAALTVLVQTHGSEHGIKDAIEGLLRPLRVTLAKAQLEANQPQPNHLQSAIGVDALTEQGILQNRESISITETQSGAMLTQTASLKGSAFLQDYVDQYADTLSSTHKDDVLSIIQLHQDTASLQQHISLLEQTKTDIQARIDTHTQGLEVESVDANFSLSFLHGSTTVPVTFTNVSTLAKVEIRNIDGSPFQTIDIVGNGVVDLALPSGYGDVYIYALDADGAQLGIIGYLRTNDGRIDTIVTQSHNPTINLSIPEAEQFLPAQIAVLDAQLDAVHEQKSALEQLLTNIEVQIQAIESEAVHTDLTNLSSSLLTLSSLQIEQLLTDEPQVAHDNLRVALANLSSQMQSIDVDVVTIENDIAEVLSMLQLAEHTYLSAQADMQVLLDANWEHASTDTIDLDSAVSNSFSFGTQVALDLNTLDGSVAVRSWHTSTQGTALVDIPSNTITTTGGITSITGYSQQRITGATFDIATSDGLPVTITVERFDRAIEEFEAIDGQTINILDTDGISSILVSHASDSQAVSISGLRIHGTIHSAPTNQELEAATSVRLSKYLATRHFDGIDFDEVTAMNNANVEFRNLSSDVSHQDMNTKYVLHGLTPNTYSFLRNEGGILHIHSIQADGTLQPLDQHSMTRLDSGTIVVHPGIKYIIAIEPLSNYGAEIRENLTREIVAPQNVNVNWDRLVRLSPNAGIGFGNFVYETRIHTNQRGGEFTAWGNVENISASGGTVTFSVYSGTGVGKDGNVLTYETSRYFAPYEKSSLRLPVRIAGDFSENAYIFATYPDGTEEQITVYGATAPKQTVTTDRDGYAAVENYARTISDWEKGFALDLVERGYNDNDATKIEQALNFASHLSAENLSHVFSTSSGAAQADLAQIVASLPTQERAAIMDNADPSARQLVTDLLIDSAFEASTDPRITAIIEAQKHDGPMSDVRAKYLAQYMEVVTHEDGTSELRLEVDGQRYYFGIAEAEAYDIALEQIEQESEEVMERVEEVRLQTLIEKIYEIASSENGIFDIDDSDQEFIVFTAFNNPDPSNSGNETSVAGSEGIFETFSSSRLHEALNRLLKLTNSIDNPNRQLRMGSNASAIINNFVASNHQHWYHLSSDVPSTSELEARGDTVIGRFAQGLLQRLWQFKDQPSLIDLMAIETQSVIGIDMERLRSLHMPDIHTLVNEVDSLFIEYGYDHIFSASGITPESLNGLKVSTDNSTYTNGYMRVIYDATRNNEDISHARAYLLSNNGTELELSNGNITNSYYVDIPIDSIGVNGSEFLVKVAAWQVGSNTGIGGLTDSTISIQWDGTESIPLGYERVGSFNLSKAAWQNYSTSQQNELQEILDMGNLDDLGTGSRAIIEKLVQDYFGTDNSEQLNNESNNIWGGYNFQTGIRECKDWLQNVIINGATGTLIANNVGQINHQSSWDHLDTERMANVEIVIENGTTNTLSNNLESIKAGDIIQWANGEYQHTMVVGGIEDDGIWFFDTNFGEDLAVIAQEGETATHLENPNAPGNFITIQKAVEQGIQNPIATHILKEENKVRYHKISYSKIDRLLVSYNVYRVTEDLNS